MYKFKTDWRIVCRVGVYSGKKKKKKVIYLNTILMYKLKTHWTIVCDGCREGVLTKQQISYLNAILIY